MRVQVGDVSLWFEVQGTRYVVEDERLVERPTIVLVHGGPGLDSTSQRIQADLYDSFAQVVYFDQRGNGRSDHSGPEHWNLEQWADDLRGFCDALGIVKPIVIGGSFGGMVTQVYAGRHPDHPAAIGLLVTAMRHDDRAMVEAFRRLGGDEVAAVAERDAQDPTPETAQAFFEACLPYYSVKPGVADFLAALTGRSIRTVDTEVHFTRLMQTMDLRPWVDRIQCPALVLGGAGDPVIVPDLMDELAAALGDRLWRYESVEGSSHLLPRDQPERLREQVREFVLAHAHLQPSQTPA